MFCLGHFENVYRLVQKKKVQTEQHFRTLNNERGKINLIDLYFSSMFQKELNSIHESTLFFGSGNIDVCKNKSK